MNKVSRDILNKVPVTRIMKRIWYMDKIYKSIISDYAELPYSFTINDQFLYIAIKSYFYDIERLKHFHGIERVEHYKIAGYSAKWLNKIRPISFAPTAKEIDSTPEKVVLINERFALQSGFVISGIIGENEREDVNIYRKIMWEMLYMFQYRDISGDQMAMWYKHLANHKDAILSTG